MKRPVSVIVLLTALSSLSRAPSVAAGPTMVTEDFEFRSGGRTLSGLIDQPANVEARALIVFVHGSGMTDVRGENRYIDLRRRFAELGIASVVWDKPGMGRSEGEYDPNQPLAESAQEVLDAIAYVRRERIPGAQKIGIWGTSRGTWVAPLAMAEDDGIEFWISVSGVPAADNKYYLLASNLPLEGRTEEETARLLTSNALRGSSPRRHIMSFRTTEPSGPTNRVHIMARKPLPGKFQLWIDARKRHHLSHAQVQMARELGMDPRRLGKIDNAGQERWKVPLPRFIEQSYEKRFGRTSPAAVLPMEDRARLEARKQAARADEKAQRRAELVGQSGAEPGSAIEP